MKTKRYLIVLSIILLFGCRSIEKLVDQGRYDDAIYLATKKLAGKKNKKTKHIRALEEAFAKVNAQDLNRIDYLKSSADSSVWDEIYSIMTRVEWRQDRIAGFLPLISKEGYVADFAFLNPGLALNDAALNATSYHYNNGVANLEKAKKTGSKWFARESFDDFSQARKYVHDYKNSQDLQATAKLIGTTHVLVKWEDQFQSALPEHSIFSISGIRNLNYTWTAFYGDHPAGISLDQVATIRLNDFYISPEREEVNRLIERRRIESWVDATNRRGETLFDSSGNVIQVLYSEDAEARILEIERYKTLQMNGLVEVVDYEHGEIIHTEPWEVTINFASNACQITGDRRALSDNFRKRGNSRVEPFPSDFSMIAEAVGLMNDKSFRILEAVNWNQFISEPYAIN